MSESTRENRREAENARIIERVKDNALASKKIKDSRKAAFARRAAEPKNSGSHK